MEGVISVGVDVGGTNIELAAVCENRVVCELHRKYPKGETAEGLCSSIADSISELVCAYKGESTKSAVLSSVGIAMPGGLDIRRGIVNHAYNLNLHDAHITDIMSRLMENVHFSLINDADAATLGEFKLGALKGVSSGCLITLGTGVGAGLIIDGKLYRGGKMRGTELGHMTLDISGSKCTCGNTGCIETLCSASYIEREGRRIYSDESMTAKRVFDNARAGDARASAIFDRYIDNLSSALATYIALLDPEVIALGGGVSLSGEFLLEPLRKKTAEKAFFKPICDIVCASLKDKAGAIGAAFAE